MLIEVFSSLFDDIGLEARQRRNAARALVRTLCRITTYRTEVDTYLGGIIGTDRESKKKERKVFKWWQSNRCNRDLVMMFWRGMHCFVHTENAEYAESLSGIHQRDLRYALSCLNTKDIAEIKKSKLSWRRKPITQKSIKSVLDSCQGTIRHYAYKLKFVTMCEGSLLHEDIVSMLELEALALIIRYECERDRVYLRNTVIRGLKSAWSELSSYYKCEKRDALPSYVVEDDNGKHFEFESIRQGLTVKSNSESGDSEIENPALLSRCVNIDTDIEVRSIVDMVRRKLPRYGRYLGLCVLDDKDRKFHKWLNENNKTTKTAKSYRLHARRYCGVTAHDEQLGKRMVAKELGLVLA